MAGHHVYPFEQLHFYTGSKFAVRALSEALRQEIQAAKSGIRVSVHRGYFVHFVFSNIN